MIIMQNDQASRLAEKRSECICVCCLEATAEIMMSAGLEGIIDRN